MGIVGSSSTSSTMCTINLLSIVFGLFALSFICEGTLKEDFCSDLSYWDVVKYTSTVTECCDTVLKKECKTKTETVCEEVIETKCDAVGWAECSTKIGSSGKKNCQVTYKDFPYRACKYEKFPMKHEKEVPECKTVTRDYCVTDWNIDENGTKVWGGKEKCEPVSWEECKIVKKTVDFIADRTNCETKGSIKWVDFIQGNVDVVEMEQSCELKTAVNCHPVTVKNCVDVSFTECELKGDDICSSLTVHEPKQEKKHQKKCYHVNQL